ncbi:ATP-binding cassette domain-containing protein, partial [Vibrio sp.]|uniref:ATP-binding cassette domain-containing protein n=1 Tax=Vibrio sp. TaxID=678 RepID=UPI003D0C1B09
YALYPHMTVRDNIGFALTMSKTPKAEIKQRTEAAAELLGLTEYLDRLPKALSGGQRQRVALARCFVQSHPIWLLDEPFSALDPLLREEMLQLVKRLAAERNITLLMVTHHLSDAKAIASDFAFMRQGRIEVTGPIRELTAQHCCPALAQFVAAGQ